MCGIVGVINDYNSSDSEAAADLHNALYLLQHRGQDACGIATCAAGGKIYQCKGNGMASKVFLDGERISELPGSMGIGHLRYPTAGSSANAEAQPFYVNSPYGICLAVNGNILNTRELKRFLDQEAHRHSNTDSDSELMLNVFANELNETKKARVNAEDCFASLERTYAKCIGSWACTALVAGFGLIGFRDPYGIRPLVLGSRTLEGQGTDYMMASESVALQYFGCNPDEIVDILPGQAVIIEKGQKPVFRQIEQPKNYAPDIFEFVYFARQVRQFPYYFLLNKAESIHAASRRSCDTADMLNQANLDIRPDSIIDGISVYATRRNMGFKLAQTIEKKLGKETLDEIDAVIPIPETSNTSARCVAKHLGKELVDGFTKNRYIFRTFIMPSKFRRTGVRRKLNPMRQEFKGKNVLLVDDSIVRGNTACSIVLMAREAGAKKVFFASCAPAITHAHIYGIDLASSDELIAHHKTDEDIAREIGADAMIFQTLPDLESACAELSPRDPKTQKFEVGVFSGKYVTPVEDDYFEHLEHVRRGRKKMKINESAKRAIVNGDADEEMVREIQSKASCKRSRGHDDAQDQVGPPSGKNSQDISLYNLNDYS